jgi:hypothetical protein
LLEINNGVNYHYNMKKFINNIYKWSKINYRIKIKKNFKNKKLIIIKRIMIIIIVKLKLNGEESSKEKNLLI